MICGYQDIQDMWIRGVDIKHPGVIELPNCKGTNGVNIVDVFNSRSWTTCVQWHRMLEMSMSEVAAILTLPFNLSNSLPLSVILTIAWSVHSCQSVLFASYYVTLQDSITNWEKHIAFQSVSLTLLSMNRNECWH